VNSNINIIKKRSPSHLAWFNLPRGRELLVSLAGSAFFGMLVMLVSKELVAEITIQARAVSHACLGVDA